MSSLKKSGTGRSGEPLSSMSASSLATKEEESLWGLNFGQVFNLCILINTLQTGKKLQRAVSLPLISAKQVYS